MHQCGRYANIDGKAQDDANKKQRIIISERNIVSDPPSLVFGKNLKNEQRPIDYLRCIILESVIAYRDDDS